MIGKLRKYVTLASQKTALICAMILDPRIKLSYFKQTQSFLLEHNISTLLPCQILKTFLVEDWSFDWIPSWISQDTSLAEKTDPVKTKKISVIETGIFYQSPAVAVKDLNGEIQMYLSEQNEDLECNILHYWPHHTKVYPSPAAMVKCYLGISAI